jgi:hypothetical protein
MNETDDALRRTWALAEQRREEELADAIEPVLATLIEAGYAEADGPRWRFTDAGVARAKSLAARETSDVRWPFEEDRFPPDLGVVAMRTILDGEMPCLQVVHAAEDWWGFADGVDSPNGDASVTSHVHHLLELDPSLHELAALPLGFQADRDDPHSPWVISEFAYGDD